MRKMDDPGSEKFPKRDRVAAGAFTVGVHLAVLAALLWPRGTPPAKPESVQDLTMVSLADTPKPPGPPDAAAKSDDSQDVVQPPTVPQVSPPVLTIATTRVPDNSDILSESQLAGATSAGEEGAGGGGGGGSCDTARAVQRALRRDPLVRAAVQNADRLGKATMLWNGDWVRSGIQDGKGLSAVREAIMWEVGFSPESCRNQPMHGVVLLSLTDGTRFAIGSGDWRWSDLLGIRKAVR